MSKKTYWEKLKDPRWQKLRLEVMAANDFCCEVCGDSTSTLKVHHKEYFKGHEPWEYEIKQLAVLCESCHESTHDGFDSLKWVCSIAPIDGPTNRDELAFLIAGFLGMDREGLHSISQLYELPRFKKIWELGEKSYADLDDWTRSISFINRNKNGKD